MCGVLRPLLREKESVCEEGRRMSESVNVSVCVYCSAEHGSPAFEEFLKILGERINVIVRCGNSASPCLG
jgi:hypothetical protein